MGNILQGLFGCLSYMCNYQVAQEDSWVRMNPREITFLEELDTIFFEAFVNLSITSQIHFSSGRGHLCNWSVLISINFRENCSDGGFKTPGNFR